MEKGRVSIGNKFYVDLIEHLSTKEKRHILNALSIYCTKKNYTQAVIEHVYNAGLSGAVTLRIKVQEDMGIHSGVFKVDYHKEVEKEKINFDRIRSVGGTGSSLFMNIDWVEVSKNELKESGYKAVVEYTAVDGLAESITDLKTLFYEYYYKKDITRFAKDFSKIIHSVFVSNLGLNGVLYSNQRYSSKFYDVHFNRNLQKPPREVFGAEWPPNIRLEEAKWLNDGNISPEDNPLHYDENQEKNATMLNNLEKGKSYLFSLQLISYDISSTKRIENNKYQIHFKFIVPGKYRIDSIMNMEEDERNDFLDYLDNSNLIYIKGIYTKNSTDVLIEAINKIGLDARSDNINFSDNITYPNIIHKVSNLLDNQRLKVFMECLAYNDPNYNNLLISNDQSVKIIDYAMIGKNGLYYDLARFETIMKMEFIFDTIYPKYKNNIDLFYKTIIYVENLALSETKVENLSELDDDVRFLYVFIMMIRYYMVALADMHYLHTFNEFKSGAFLREYMYSMMFFNISFLKFKHDPPERKRLALLYASYFMENFEKSRFVSPSSLNDKIYNIKKEFETIISSRSKTEPKEYTKKPRSTKFSIETILNIINSEETEQKTFFENMYKIKSANRLFDDFLENYFEDYKSDLSQMFLNLSKETNNPDIQLWTISKLNKMSSDKRDLKFEVLKNCSLSTDYSVKRAIISQLYNLAGTDLAKSVDILLILSKGMDSRTLLLIVFLLRCEKSDTGLAIQILSSILKDNILLSIKYNILVFLKENYFQNTKDARKILKYLLKESNSSFKTELNDFIESI